jgi:hypothetical protein
VPPFRASACEACIRADAREIPPGFWLRFAAAAVVAVLGVGLPARNPTEYGEALAEDAVVRVLRAEMLGAATDAWLNVGEGGAESTFIANGGSGGSSVFALLTTGRGDSEIERFPPERGFDSVFATDGPLVEAEETWDTMLLAPRIVWSQPFMAPIVDMSKLRSYNVRSSEAGRESKALVS